MTLRNSDYATYGNVMPVHSAVNDQTPLMSNEEWNAIDPNVQANIYDLLSLEVIDDGRGNPLYN